MTTNITEYPNVMERLNEFGCNVPIGIALLPVNFETADSVEELRQVTEGATVKTLLRSANLPIIDIFPPEKRPPYIQNNAFDWLAPPLLIPLAIISQNPHVVDIALNVIANYISEVLFRIERRKEDKTRRYCRDTRFKWLQENFLRGKCRRIEGSCECSQGHQR